MKKLKRIILQIIFYTSVWLMWTGMFIYGLMTATTLN